LRLLVWGGAALLVVLFFSDLGWLVSPRPSADQPRGEPKTADDAGPGWPHLRGPHYNGISAETGLADSWPPEGPPVLWIREIGQGYSAFTAAEGRVYTQTQSTYSQSVVSLDGDTGRPIWQHRYGWPYDGAGMYPGPRATPTYSDGRVYFAGPRGLIGCLDAADGRLVWSVNVLETFDGKGSHFGYACSPLVEQDMVILPVGGEGASLVALHARDGSARWTSGDEPSSYCSAIPITLAGRRHVVAFLENTLVLVDLKTGHPLWKQDFSSGYDEHSAFPLYEEPHLMVTSPFRGGSEMVRLDCVDPAPSADAPSEVAATRVWFSRKMSNDVASSVAVDGYVYGFDLRDIQSKAHRPSRGKFTCMELETGDVLWTTDQAGHASLLVADGKLILFNDTGQVLLVRATPERYEELARTQVFGDEICWTAPALDRGRLYLRTPTKAACLYLGRPENLSRELLDAARPAAEIPKPRRFDYTRLLGGEREYPADRPTPQELASWYVVCLLAVFGVAAIAAAVVYLGLRWPFPVAARRSSRVVFWTAAFALGLAATTVLNTRGHAFVFTWPASLFVVHQVTLIAVLQRSRQGQDAGSWWFPAAMGLAFFAAALGYFHVCRALALAAEWLFLLGFLPSWPVAIPAAFRLRGDVHPIEDLLWALLSFSLYYWASGAYLIWGPG
ncbi:MAG: PQQ-like beta-propeller repeat protein, partial [Planctomycetes bacterium]|nr:PQQ-like beta-propeller repeat protein [Planctomycetota bacterium]